MLTHTQKVLWENIYFPRRPVYIPKVSAQRGVRGFDTETLNGYAKILCDDSGNKLDIEVGDIDSILTFMSNKKYRNTFNFFYNLRFDTYAIVKHLPAEYYHTLITQNEVEYKDYKIFLLPKKILSIKKGRHTVKYYDDLQFYESSLDNAAKKYISSRKEPDGLDRALIGSSSDYWEEHYDKIVKYCIQDCIVCKELGELLNKTIIDSLDMFPKSYMSAASLSKQYFTSRCEFWNLRNIPKSVHQFAYQAYSGGWFEMFKKGHFKGEIVDSDINSAYPDAIRNFPDINKGEWIRTKTVTPKALLGFYSAIVNVPKGMYIPPVPIRFKNGSIRHPTGEFQTVLTKLEVDSYQNDIDINILQGWEYFDESPTYPFRTETNRLYNLKNELAYNNQKDRFEYVLYKKIMNSFYGNTFQKNPISENKRTSHVTHKSGGLFNPIMASFITAWCRVKIYNAIKGHEHQIISIATDGIKSIGNLGLENSLELGAWEIHTGYDFLMFQPGISLLDSEVKTRGMEKSKNIITPEGKEYKHLFEYLKKEPHRNKYTFEIERPLGGLECLISKKYTQEDVNIFVEKSITKDINSDEKRVWDKTFRHGGELMHRRSDSIPYHIE